MKWRKLITHSSVDTAGTGGRWAHNTHTYTHLETERIKIAYVSVLPSENRAIKWKWQAHEYTFRKIVTSSPFIFVYSWINAYTAPSLVVVVFAALHIVLCVIPRGTYLNQIIIRIVSTWMGRMWEWKSTRCTQDFDQIHHWAKERERERDRRGNISIMLFLFEQKWPLWLLKQPLR